jgi:hypothetical protein
MSGAYTPNTEIRDTDRREIERLCAVFHTELGGDPMALAKAVSRIVASRYRIKMWNEFAQMREVVWGSLEAQTSWSAREAVVDGPGSHRLRLIAVGTPDDVADLLERTAGDLRAEHYGLSSAMLDWDLTPNTGEAGTSYPADSAPNGSGG